VYGCYKHYGLDPAVIEINGRASLPCNSVRSEPAGRSENTKDLMALFLDTFPSILCTSVVSRIYSIWYSCLVAHSVHVLVLSQAIT